MPDNEIRIGESTFIAFPRDAHPLRGIYPPICRLGDWVQQTGVGDDGHLFELVRHDRAWLAEEAKHGHIAILDHPVGGTSSDIIVCIKDEDTHLFQGFVDLQPVRKAPVHAARLSIEMGYDLLGQVIKERVPHDDLKHRKELRAMMITCKYLNNPSPSRLGALISVMALTLHEKKAIEEMKALTRIYLTRFGKHPKIS